MRKLSDEIEALILEGGLEAGARLPSERKLAVDFGVSRSRLREAIQQLVSRGILTARQGGGTFVAAPAPSAASPLAGSPLDKALSPLSSLARMEPGYWQDVMEIRKSLDGDTAYCAALRAGDEDRARLTAAFERLIKAEGADEVTQARADAAFHMAVAEASHNAVLRQVMAGLFDLLQHSISASLEKLYRLPRTAHALEDQHRLIFEAIMEGRADDARNAALRHLDFVEDSLRLIEDAAARERRSVRALSRAAIQKEARS
ncbi:UNVERIFIED_ORG: GntR family L-lactate dehydrogenase operon transcriptional regulator [Xanthobacter viscosus]|uniref:FCD domain-containing protein n=1 Tax=Xanthobacter autotrophicus TaxID=280 RepID=A0A6C1KNM7_XANAU|nr:FCD domain-containing protein [Xanthobacter autotrophicus]TLX44934.1 FCD domain-containing protein [Xanthobacter autotrophicus]